MSLLTTSYLGMLAYLFVFLFREENSNEQQLKKLFISKQISNNFYLKASTSCSIQSSWIAVRVLDRGSLLGKELV